MRRPYLAPEFWPEGWHLSEKDRGRCGFCRNYEIEVRGQSVKLRWDNGEERLLTLGTYPTIPEALDAWRNHLAAHPEPVPSPVAPVVDPDDIPFWPPHRETP